MNKLLFNIKTTKETSPLIQELLFRHGYYWRIDGKRIVYDYGSITASSCKELYTGYSLTLCKEITFSELLDFLETGELKEEEVIQEDMLIAVKQWKTYEFFLDNCRPMMVKKFGGFTLTELDTIRDGDSISIIFSVERGRERKVCRVDGTYLDYNASIVYKSDPYEVEQIERITKEWVRK